MKLEIQGANRTVLRLNDGTEIFFSYETPVAGRWMGGEGSGFFKSSKSFSVTTSKHIGQYFNDRGADRKDVEVVDQSFIENLVKAI